MAAYPAVRFFYFTKNLKNCIIKYKGERKGEKDMGNFKRYIHIEHTDSGDIKQILAERLTDEQKNAVFCGQEKVDGANIGIYITADDYTIGSRNMSLEENDDFYDVKSAMTDDINDLIVCFQAYIKENEDIDHVIINGELFGKTIINRIYYCDGLRILFFDLRINDSYVSPKQMMKMFENFGHANLVVPTLIVGTLQECMDFDVENTTSVVSADSTQPIEGIVIKPLYEIIIPAGRDMDNIFYIKKKAQRFKELRKKKVEKLQATYEIEDEWESMFCENRVLTVFSKLGVISSKSEIGKYLSAIVQDCAEEIHLDKYEKECQRKLKKTGAGLAFEELRKVAPIQL